MAVGENTLKQIIAVEEAKLEALKAQLEIIKAGGKDTCDTEKKPVKAKAGKKEEAKTPDVDTSAFEEMTVKDLIALADANEVSVARAGKNKKYYIDRLVKAGVTPDAMNEPEADDEEEANEYAGKSAKELFTLCKERGIECKPKQKADAYIALLKADDEAGSDDDWEEDEAESEDDDWGDDEDEAVEEKPAKKAPAKKATKGGKKAPAKKPVKEEVEDDEEDDDWDI